MSKKAPFHLGLFVTYAKVQLKNCLTRPFLSLDKTWLRKHFKLEDPFVHYYISFEKS